MEMQMHFLYSIGDNVWAFVEDELVYETIVGIEIDFEGVVFYKLNGLSNRFLEDDLYETEPQIQKSEESSKKWKKKKFQK